MVVRNPAWLAIDGAAWRTQRSNVVRWRGWELSLIARPTGLEFLIDFVPDPERPTEAFSGVVPCVGPDDGFAVVSGRGSTRAKRAAGGGFSDYGLTRSALMSAESMHHVSAFSRGTKPEVALNVPSTAVTP